MATRHIYSGRGNRDNVNGVNANFKFLWDNDSRLESLIQDAKAKAKSAYDLWLESGNTGTIEDFFDSLKGANGEDANIDFITSGKNIFDPRNLEVGRIGTNGAVYVVDTHRTTQYLPIEPSTTYFTNKTMYTGQYDTDMIFIKYLYVPANNTFTTESNVKYMRFGVGANDINTIQIEKGSIATPYEPFKRVFTGISLSEVDDARTSTTKNITYSNLSSRIAEIEKDVLEIDPTSISATDEQAESVFIAEMNKKALTIGMSRAKWQNASGLTAPGQTSNAKDLALLLRYTFNVPLMLSIWGKKTYNVDIKGANARTIPITTTVTDTAFEQEYEILGGKTGTLGIIRNLAVLAKHKTTGKLIAGVVIKTDDDRWVALKQAFDAVINGTTSTDTISADGACAFLVQQNSNLRLWETFEPELDRPNTALQSPASITKLLTCITAIESGISLDTSFSYIESDMTDASTTVKTGDIITLRDAMFFAMLASNNTSAKAIGRIVGHHLIKTRGNV
ncbi:hypothetical protein LAU42_08820 [Macrococcus armenti]|uniref:hypothetical protein n=1 Tax=Macrococcus armenti TaxID=2875764 RepID=UPI001CCBE044|nr:hypothetical protein [Macrococcus armenti]UBH21868.1 hypothetical protein LAU42_08820 [Macrococcus armenti]